LRIYKAILLTILLIAVLYIPQILFVLIYEHTNLFGEGFIEHLYAVYVISQFLSYRIIFYYFKIPIPKIKSAITIKELNLNPVPYLILIVIGLSIILEAFLKIDDILHYYKTLEFESYSNSSNGIKPFHIYFAISSLLIAPFFEEIFFRKFLLSKLIQNNGIWISIFVSSLCFASIHFETPKNLLPTFIFGVIACYIYLKTEKIKYTIIIHFLHNFYLTILPIWGESIILWRESLKYNFVYWTLFLMGIILTLIGIKKITTANKLHIA